MTFVRECSQELQGPNERTTALSQENNQHLNSVDQYVFIPLSVFVYPYLPVLIYVFLLQRFESQISKK